MQPQSPAVIRDAHAEDAATVHAFVAALAEVQGQGDKVTSTPEDMARDGLRPGGAFEAILAEADGGAVGFALFLFKYSTWSGTPVLYVEDIFVDETMRGTGLGAKLMARLGRIALERGCGRLELLVAEENKARQFYEALGLARFQTWMPYSIHGAPLEALAGRDSA